MSLLTFVWTLSMSLVAVSVFGLATILAARPFGAWRDRSVISARAGILQVLLEPGTSKRVLGRRVRRATRLKALAPVMLEVLGLVRGEARKNFVESLTRAGTAEALRKSLRDGKPQVRQCAAEALAAFAPSESEAALQQAWWDPHPGVRFAALRASILIGAPPAFSDILDVAQAAAPRERAQGLALIKLMSERFPRAARPTLTLAEAPVATRVAVIDGLAANLDQGALDVLLAIADDPAPQIRAACIAAFARRPGLAGDAFIVKGLGHADWSVRASAALAAGKVRLASARTGLQALRHDEHWWVRLRASEALHAIDPLERDVVAA